jgi:uncharacterized membrane protein
MRKRQAEFHQAKASQAAECVALLFFHYHPGIHEIASTGLFWRTILQALASLESQRNGTARGKENRIRRHPQFAPASCAACGGAAAIAAKNVITPLRHMTESTAARHAHIAVKKLSILRDNLCVFVPVPTGGSVWSHFTNI